MFSGYAAAFATTARLTEGAPGCVVLARLAWLAGEGCRSQYGWSPGFEGRTARIADPASARRRRSVARLP